MSDLSDVVGVLAKNNPISALASGAASGIFEGAAKIIGLFKTDPALAMKHAEVVAQFEQTVELAKIEVAKAAAAQEVQLALAQAEITKVEAASTDKYVSRARPTTLWICNIGFGFAMLGVPLLQFWSSGWKVMPAVDTTTMVPILLATLGFGGFRMVEKIKGVAS